jgi:hypothetical protein
MPHIAFGLVRQASLENEMAVGGLATASSGLQYGILVNVAFYG